MEPCSQTVGREVLQTGRKMPSEWLVCESWSACSARRSYEVYSIRLPAVGGVLGSEQIGLYCRTMADAMQVCWSSFLLAQTTMMILMLLPHRVLTHPSACHFNIYSMRQWVQTCCSAWLVRHHASGTRSRETRRTTHLPPTRPGRTLPAQRAVGAASPHLA